MDFLTLAKERYSVRSFSTKPIEKEKLDKIIKAGMLAPTGCNLQPQRVLVVQSKEGLEKLKKCTKYTFDAPTCLVVCYDKTDCWTRKYDNKTCGEVDASIVTTHMMMQAYEIGIGSTWVMSFNPTELISQFNIPENYVPVALLPIGYPSDSCTPSVLHEKCKNEDEVIFYEKF